MLNHTPWKKFVMILFLNNFQIIVVKICEVCLIMHSLDLKDMQLYATDEICELDQLNIENSNSNILFEFSEVMFFVQ